jgi:hypothetical protein
MKQLNVVKESLSQLIKEKDDKIDSLTKELEQVGSVKSNQSNELQVKLTTALKECKEFRANWSVTYGASLFCSMTFE